MPSAVVFGARNLGGAIARGLLADGYQVASVARTKADLDRLAAEAAFPVSAASSIGVSSTASSIASRTSLHRSENPRNTRSAWRI